MPKTTVRRFVPAYCRDCGEDTAPPDKRGRRVTWKVDDRIWRKAKMKPHEHLCQRCLARRLGRELVFLDFQWVAGW